MTALLYIIIVLLMIVAIIRLLAANRQKTNEPINRYIPTPNTVKTDRFTTPVINPQLPNNSGFIKWDKAVLKELEWKLFENLCMEFLKIKNCNAMVTSTGADGGIDIKVHDKLGNIIAIAQCKAWNNRPIGVNLIRELYGIMASDRVRHGVFLTTSTFTYDAKEFAKGKPILLIDADEFLTQINKLSDEDKKKIETLIYQDDRKIPTCVKCNIKLIRRTAKTGAKAGREFWGCVNYPKCKITMNIRKEHING